MSYISKLSLSPLQRLRAGEFLKEIHKQQEWLREQYKEGDYITLNADEKLSVAKNLLLTNIPAAALLLQDLMTHKVSVKQKILCLHNLHMAYMALGPLSKGLKYAEEQYQLTKNAFDLGKLETQNDVILSEILQLCFQATCDFGNAHRSLGNLEKAKIFLDEAKDIATNMADRDNVALATIYNGYWLLESGQLKIAMTEVFKPLMEESLSAANRGCMLQGFGNACRSAADWGPSKDYLRESIAIAEKLNNTVAVADRQGDLGTVYRSEGRTADALEYQQKHYQFAMKRGDRVGLCVAFFNLGFTHYSSKPPQFNSATLYHTIQLELSHSIQFPGMKSRALNCLGKVFTGLGKFEDAIQLFNECADLHMQNGNVAGLGMAYGNLGTAYRKLAQYDDAVIFHEKYRDNANERDDVGGVAIMQREIALDYIFMGDYEMAENSIKEALITLEEIRIKLGPEDTSRIANYEKNQAEAYNLLQMILVRRGKTTEALALAEGGRARALADLIRSKVSVSEKRTMASKPTIAVRDDKQDSQQDTIQEVVDGTFAESEDADNIFKLVKKLNTTLLVYSIITEYDAQSPAGSKWVYIWVVNASTVDSNEDGNVPIVHFGRTQLKRNEPKQVNAVDGNAVDSQYVNSLCRSFGNLNVDEIQELHEEDTSISHRSKGEDVFKNDWTIDERSRDLGNSYYRPQKQEDKKLLMNKKEDKNAVVVEKTGLDHRKQQTMYQKLKADYNMFIAPIEDYLPEVTSGGDDGEVPRITIIPQDFLFNLPFCALLCPDGKHLVEKYIISFAPSIKVLQLTHRRLNAIRQQNMKIPLSVLAIGNPRMPHPKLVSLPAAYHEVQMVKRHFEIQPGFQQSIEGSRRIASLVATDTDATVDLVREHMGKHDVLHFATHAEQNDGIAEMIRKGSDRYTSKPVPRGDFNMRGFLVLARSNSSCSGLLTAEEIKAQHLKAEVAVLSCCQTGMGQVTGDGVLGLYRSFLAAGVTSVVVTHWKIYDRATAKFMQYFYQEFQAHRDPARALRTAMLRMLQDKRNHAPQHWAAFALIGASATATGAPTIAKHQLENSEVTETSATSDII